MLQVLREEFKYQLNPVEALCVRRRLEPLLVQDEHNGASGYLVRSLYFDTLYDEDYYDKVNGLELRRKLRLRLYPGSSSAKLEEKKKQGSAQLKRSLRLSRDDAERLIQGDFSPLLRQREAFAQECYAMLTASVYRPKTIVQYRRLAFVNPVGDTRITLDSELTFTESRFDLFADDLNLSPVICPFGTVLEVKHNGFFLSYIKDALQGVDKRFSSVSKYCLARQCSYQISV